MKEYNINNKKIELDTEKTYLDFYWEGNQPQLVNINLEKMLEAFQSQQIPLDEETKDYMAYLSRWKEDAPRKRGKRMLRKQGFTVLTTDYLFEEDGGEEIIDNLENTGVFAAYFLEQVYGV